MSSKVYAVSVGRKTGIFYDWFTTEEQVKGVPGALFSSFRDEAEAKRWLKETQTRLEAKKAKVSTERKLQTIFAASNDETELLYAVFTNGEVYVLDTYRALEPDNFPDEQWVQLPTIPLIH